jgi:hypothetical protein
VPAGVLEDVEPGDHRVERQRPGVVGDDQRAVLGGQVLDAVRADAPVVAVQRPQQRHHDRLGQVDVEAVLVDLVVAGQPPAQEPGRLADVVEEALTGHVAQRLEGVHGGRPAATCHLGVDAGTGGVTLRVGRGTLAAARPGGAMRRRRAPGSGRPRRRSCGRGGRRWSAPRSAGVHRGPLRRRRAARPSR